MLRNEFATTMRRERTMLDWLARLVVVAGMLCIAQTASAKQVSATSGATTVSETGPATAAERSRQYLQFIRQSAATLRVNETVPATLADWQEQRQKVRAALARAWGPFPVEHAPLASKVLGTLVRDGYRVEKVTFQTLPDVWMTANAYVPDVPGPLPAVLCVHGHWRGAKQDPVVQSRCIGLAKLGFFVLVVDAFGAGERGVGKKLGEYHGSMTAATLLPVGMPLSGLQVYENMRAVDYLGTRSEVDPERIGITGASGGGNQTMYAGAWDERFRAVVPVCSVGNYQAYLGPACCMCELVPGLLRDTEEWGVLGLTAPRGLMVISATKDASQFSVYEARKSIAKAGQMFDLLGRSTAIKHALFESPHDYNAAMREAMYGWMTAHLKGTGDGAPIKEPTIKTEEPEMLRCYPGETRADDWMTIPRFAARHARALLAQRSVPSDAAAWNTAAAGMRDRLRTTVLGLPERSETRLLAAPADAEVVPNGRLLVVRPEPGIDLHVHLQTPRGAAKRLAVVLDCAGRGTEAVRSISATLAEGGAAVATFDLRATGVTKHARDVVGPSPDHTTAQWGMWIGRPLLGQWTVDVRAVLDACERTLTKLPEDVMVVGVGPAGVVALTAATLDKRIGRVATFGTLASYVSDEPYAEQRMGTLAPRILPEVGDIPHLAALVLPRPLTIANPTTPQGQPLPAESLRTAFAPTLTTAKLLNCEATTTVIGNVETITFARSLLK